MPKATEAKGRPAASPLTSRARRRRDSPSPSDSTDRDPKPSLELDKSLVLEILVAKLDGSKAFDWFTLAQKLGSQDTSTADGVATRVSPAGPGSKAKKRVSGAQCNPKDSKTPSFGGWTGAQLHDLYHNIILPALKEGRALWTETSGPWTPSTVIEPSKTVSNLSTAKASGRKRRKSTTTPKPAMPVTPTATVADGEAESDVFRDNNNRDDEVSDADKASLGHKGSPSSLDSGRAPRSTPRRYTRKAAINYSYFFGSGSDGDDD